MVSFINFDKICEKPKMAYFQYLMQNNILKNNEGCNVGTCNAMCPEEEVKMREEARLIHVLEKLGPIVRKYVKSYHRSAADNKTMTQPHLLRPFPVLKETVQYLLLEVTKRQDIPLAIVYDFVDDRLRAVRQDMTVQRLPPDECTTLLEPIIRFYVFFGYRLCEYPTIDFDPVLNKKHLLECLKWYLTCCKSVEELDSLSTTFSAMCLGYKLKCDRVLVESLYILSNLDDVSPLFRYLTLPKHLKSHPKLSLAYQIAVSNLRGNFVQVCRLMDQLCPLTHCAMCVYLPILQRRALQTMSHAYSSKTLTVPAAALRQWLRYSSGTEALAACAHYGLAASGGEVVFSKAAYKHDVPTLQPKKLIHNDKNFNFHEDNIFTYLS